MYPTKKITLRSSDGELFEVDEAVALESQTLKHMIEDDCAKEVIPLPNVTSRILVKVIECCKKHVEHVDSLIVEQFSMTLKANIEKIENLLKSVLQEETRRFLADVIANWKKRLVSLNLEVWDAELVKVDQATLFDLIKAANYLNIKGLLDLTCQMVADMSKGKIPEEIRETFNIRRDFTSEEGEEVLCDERVG